MRSFLILSLILISACGKLEEFKKSVGTLSPFDSSFNNISQPGSSALSSSSTFTPASYFAVVTNSGTNKDTLVYEFQYLSGQKFLIRKTVFLQGKAENGYFHKKTGTFTESSGVVKHVVEYDSCSDLGPMEFKLAGDKQGAIKLTYNSITYPLYSQSGYAFSSTVAQAMAGIVEDVGCKIFPAQ